MKAKKTYAVFGLGRYGTAVARELVEHGMEVLAVDSNMKIVNDAAAYKGDTGYKSTDELHITPLIPNHNW